MWDFLQSYGIWILFGGVHFLFMMRAHGHGSHGYGGRGMEGHEHTKQPGEQDAVARVGEKSDRSASGGCH
ncbi:MAG: hypothetical protein HW388_63 [Dehalococcoidia bacterium]|nr:hypothetical protein [Dehalococcoidia bacterium]